MAETKIKEAVKNISEKLRKGKDSQAVRLFLEYRSKGELPNTAEVVGLLNSEIGKKGTDKLIAAMLRSASLDTKPLRKRKKRKKQSHKSGQKKSFA